MTVVDAVMRGRTAAEALMLDSCTVERSAGTVTNPDTGKVYPALTAIYTGPCKIQQTLAQSSNPVAGEHRYTVQDTRWDTPVSAGPFKVGDVVTITAAVLDSQLVGRVFRVVETFHKSGATAQRTRVEEVVA